MVPASYALLAALRLARRELLLPHHRLRDHLGDVEHLDALFRAAVADAVADHDGAERAGGGDGLGVGGQQLVDAVVVHARADLLLHPHAAAAGAAAEAVLLRPFGLDAVAGRRG